MSWCTISRPRNRQGYLGLVTFSQEAGEITQFDLVIPLFRTRPEFYFLDLNLLLLALRCMGLLVLLRTGISRSP